MCLSFGMTSSSEWVGLATREAIEQISEAESEDHGPSHAESEVRHVERHIAASCHVVREHQQCHESRQHNHNHPAHNSFPPLFRCFESFREWVVFFQNGGRNSSTRSLASKSPSPPRARTALTAGIF